MFILNNHLFHKMLLSDDNGTFWKVVKVSLHKPNTSLQFAQAYVLTLPCRLHKPMCSHIAAVCTSLCTHTSLPFAQAYVVTHRCRLHKPMYSHFPAVCTSLCAHTSLSFAQTYVPTHPCGLHKPMYSHIPVVCTSLSTHTPLPFAQAYVLTHPCSFMHYICMRLAFLLENFLRTSDNLKIVLFAHLLKLSEPQ